MGLISGAHDSVESLLQAVLEPGKAPSHLYARHWHPLVAKYEAEFAKAVGVQGAVLFNSGMAAIASLREARQWGKRPLAISSELYGTTTKLLKPLAEGVFHPAQPKGLGMTDVFVESLANTFEMPLVNLGGIFMATGPGSVVVVDNTLFTPALCDVMKLARGVECSDKVLVVESATKYLQAGADRVTAGIVYGENADLLAALRKVRQTIGTHLQPSCVQHLVVPGAYLLCRMQEYSDNAYQLARELRNHPAVEVVNPPAGRSDVCFGGLLNFSLKGGEGVAVRFCNSAGLKISTSFGFDDTRLLPMGAIPEAITGQPSSGRVRVAVGLEDPFGQVIDQLKRALDMLI